MENQNKEEVSKCCGVEKMDTKMYPNEKPWCLKCGKPFEPKEERCNEIVSSGTGKIDGHVCFNKNPCEIHQPKETKEELNQCDGCQRGNHGTGLSEISCTKDKYSVKEECLRFDCPTHQGEKPCKDTPESPRIQDWEIRFDEYITKFLQTETAKKVVKDFIEKVRNQALDEQKEKNKESMRDLVGVLHKECLETQLITKEQWNTEIAPYLKRLGNVIDGYEPNSVTARNYKAPNY